MSVTKVTGMMRTSTKGGDIASASPTVIDTDGDYFDVTGTTSFTAFTVAAGRRFTVQFDGALTMTHHASTLDLPGGANITTAAGDVAEFFATGTNTVQCVNYTKADGTAVVAGGGAWNLIGTSVASDSATLDQTGIGTTYDTYVLVGTDLVPASDGVDSYMRVGDAAGGYDSGASDYAWVMANQSGGGATWQGYAGNGTAYLKIGHAHGNATGEGTGFVFYLHGKTGTSGTMKNIITGFWGGMGTGSGMNAGYFVGARDSAVISLDRVQFYFASGNIATGRFSVYGISHT